MWSPQEEEYDFDVPEDLGPLQFVKLHKQHTVVDDAWFCNLITVQGPGTSAEAVFPCYRWVQGEGILSLPEGTGERGSILPWGSGRRGKGQCWRRGCGGIGLKRRRGKELGERVGRNGTVSF